MQRMHYGKANFRANVLFKRCPLIKLLFEKVSEHNQEPQSHTAAKSRALWGTTKTINRLYDDFPAQIEKSMQWRFVCVWGGGCRGGGNIWSTVRDLGTYHTYTKICLHDCICLGGVDVGRGIEFPFHVLYLTCFCGSWTAPLANICSLYV